MDRFELNVTESNNSGREDRNERVANLYGLSKSPLLCQVRRAIFPFYVLSVCTNSSKTKSCVVGLQADGCTMDVSKMKEYNSRYKICETHLRAKVVTKDGKSQRFCQQCGKFHDVSEFDGDKRSCRARLDRHNARRRRQREMQHMLKTTGRIDEAALRAKYGLSEEELAPKVERLAKQMRISGRGQQPLLDRSSNSNASGNALAALAGFAGIPGITQEDLDLLGDSFLGEVLAPSSTTVPVMTGGGQGLTNGAADFLSIDPSSVMDLDDISVLEELTQDFGMPANVAAYAAANLPSKGSFSAGSDPLQSVLNSDAVAGKVHNTSSINLDLRGMDDVHRMHHMALDSTISNSACSNMSNGNVYHRTVTTGINPSPFARQNFVGSQSVHSYANGILNVGAPSVHPPVTPSQGGADGSAAGGGGGDGVTVAGIHTSSEPVSVLEEALNLLAYDYQSIHFMTEEKLLKFSAKLFGCTPAELPSDLRASLMDMLAVDAVEGYMRPGCVHIELNAMVANNTGEDGLHAAVQRFLSHHGTADMASSRRLVFQLENQIAVVDKGKLRHVINTSGAKSMLPRILGVDTSVVLAPQQSARQQSDNNDDCTIRLTIQGCNLDEEKDTVLLRTQGRHLNAKKIVRNDGLYQQGVLQVEVEKDEIASLGGGCLHVEIMRGSYVSPAQCLLVAPSTELLEELEDIMAVQVGRSVENRHCCRETLAYYIGVVLEASSCNNSLEQSTAALPLSPQLAATRLVPFFIQRNKPKLTKMALQVACGPDYILQRRQTTTIMGLEKELSLLFAAVRTKSFEMVDTVLEWAEQYGVLLKATQASTMHKKLTPLHLAALINDGGKIAQLLTEKCDDAYSGWRSAKAVDGSTPMELASRVGTAGPLESMLLKRKLAHLNGEHKIEASSSGTSDLNRGSKHGYSSEGLLMVKTDDSVLLQPAGHKFCLLGFYAPELEAAYGRWFHLGQLTVDRIFQTITAIYLLISIFSLSPSHHSSSTSTLNINWTVTSLLLVFNVTSLLFSMIAQRLYVRYRDLHCVMSIMLHRVASIVETAIVHSTSSSFAADAAAAARIGSVATLLDSSSLPQVLLLCIGAKGRAKFMLPALLVTLGLSMSMNAKLCAAAFPNWTVPTGGCEFCMRVLQTCCGFLLPAGFSVLMERRSRHSFLRSISFK